MDWGILLPILLGIAIGVTIVQLKNRD